MEHLGRCHRDEGLVAERRPQAVAAQQRPEARAVTSADDRGEVHRHELARRASGRTRRLSRIESTVWSMRSTWASASRSQSAASGCSDAWMRPPSSSTYARTTASGVRSACVTTATRLARASSIARSAFDLRLGLGMEAALLDEAGEEARERLEERDVGGRELARLDGLDVEHADDLVVPDERDRAHRGEPRLVDAADPGEASGRR